MRCLVPLILAACIGPACWAKPTLYIIGDSTVRNQTAGQKGWGDPLAARFVPAEIEVVNHAIGGRSSRTFLTEGRWDAILAKFKAGDFVLMQFGHNDGGEMFKGERPRASIRGNGDESETGIVEITGKEETVRSFGWYLRKYITDTKAAGATPIVLSLIPRNIWRDQRIARAGDSHAAWARQAAAQEGAAFIDFNELLAVRYEALGREATGALFAEGDHTHTNAAGAALNAGVLAAELEKTGLGRHLFRDGP